MSADQAVEVNAVDLRGGGGLGHVPLVMLEQCGHIAPLESIEELLLRLGVWNADIDRLERRGGNSFRRWVEHLLERRTALNRLRVLERCRATGRCGAEPEAGVEQGTPRLLIKRGGG